MGELFSTEFVMDASLWAAMSVALIAGLLSFLSPCVLPVAAPYLAYMGGVTVSEMDAGESRARGRVVLAAVFFVLGLSTVFIFLGYSMSIIGKMYWSVIEWINYIAGVIVIIFGLHFMGVFRFAFLMKEARFDVRDQGGSAVGAYVLGLAFAFGWTPCLGPILSAILSLAAQEANAARGAVLLGTYAAGLGIPFLMVAIYFSRLKGLMNWMKRHMGVIEKTSGVFLIIVGVLLLTGQFTVMSNWLLSTFPFLAKIG